MSWHELKSQKLPAQKTGGLYKTVARHQVL